MTRIIKIDTSDNKKIIVDLVINGKNTRLMSESTLLKSEACLPLIDKLISDQKLNLEDITNIEVNVGPGSFTGLRVGAAIANAFSYLLKVPVNNKKIGELINPIYNN